MNIRNVRRSSNAIEPLESRQLLTVVPVAEMDYLSALRATDGANGYGPIEIDKSNGENSRGDGNPLMIGGRFYRRGLGMHSTAELHYKLNSEYHTFTSDVGIDDEVGDGGSVVFKVLADGQTMFDSGVMTGASRTRRINIDVSGMNELVLVVTDAGDGNTDDHADFGNARLIKPVGAAPVIPMLPNIDLDETRAFLSAGGSVQDTSGHPLVNTVDWGDGRAREYVTLDSNNMFLLGHTYPIGPDATYTVTLRFDNGGAVGISKFLVHVDNLPPTQVGLVGQTNPDGSFNALAGLSFSAGGVFSDPGAFGGETYTATIDYGDGTPFSDVPVDGRFFDAQHVYRTPGTYTVTTTVTDQGGETGTGQSTVIVAMPTYTYVSDLKMKSRTGDFKLDRSGAGSREWINGAKYNKGIGVIADSEIVYNVGGKYQNLIADVGVDDEVDGAGAAIQFLVYADGNLVFDSGTMTSLSGAKRMNVDMRGVSELRLVATHAGTSASEINHGDWGGIRLVDAM